MAFLEIDPAYRDFLNLWGLADPDRLLGMPAVIVSGHPDRNVARVTLGGGPRAVRAFLKREHRVHWKVRFLSAWRGFGFSSQSYREFRTLQTLRAAGLPCPEPIAVGADRRGRAFLLVREVAGAADLRLHLQDRLPAPSRERREWFRRLGEALAQVHDAGFRHPDLYAKHVLVEGRTGRPFFLDWQRARRCRTVAWPQRWHDLAALDATLADDLADDRERLACLGAYLRASAQYHVPRAFFREAARQIRVRSLRLQRRRRVREQRQAPLAAGAQNLVWVRGEALCVTREFQQEMGGRLPDWLADPGPRNEVQESMFYLPGQRPARLVRRNTTRPLGWLWTRLRRRRLTSPEQEQAVALFRLQRFGVETPRLLAVGQRHPRPWRTESFLLTEGVAGAISLASWVEGQEGRPLWSAELKERRALVRDAGRMLRQIHAAGYTLERPREEHFQVRAGGGLPARPAVVLGSLEAIRCCRYYRSAWRRHDLAAVRDLFSLSDCSRTDQLRFLLSYLELPRLTPAVKRLVFRLRPTRAFVLPWRRRPACEPGQAGRLR